MPNLGQMLAAAAIAAAVAATLAAAQTAVAQVRNPCAAKTTNPCAAKNPRAVYAFVATGRQHPAWAEGTRCAT